MREEFHPMKLMWLGYLVYSFDKCAMKLCIETSLKACTTLDAYWPLFCFPATVEHSLDNLGRLWTASPLYQAAALRLRLA
jgi:hypothetical protein